MNPIEQLGEIVRTNSELKAATSTIDYFWDQPKDAETGTWFLDLIFDQGLPTSKHVVVEWRGRQPAAGLGVSCITSDTQPFGSADAWVPTPGDALRWILTACSPTK